MGDTAAKRGSAVWLYHRATGTKWGMSVTYKVMMAYARDPDFPDREIGVFEDYIEAMRAAQKAANGPYMGDVVDYFIEYPNGERASVSRDPRYCFWCGRLNCANKDKLEGPHIAVGGDEAV